MNIRAILIFLIALSVACVPGFFLWTLIVSAPTTEERLAEVTRLAKLTCGEMYSITHVSGYTKFSCNVIEGK